MHDLKETLLAIEREFWAALPDASIYQVAFADAGLMVLPMESEILDKSLLIDSVRLSSAWTAAFSAFMSIADLIGIPVQPTLRGFICFRPRC